MDSFEDIYKTALFEKIYTAYRGLQRVGKENLDYFKVRCKPIDGFETAGKWYTDTPEHAKEYGKKVIKATLDFKKPKIVNARGVLWNDIEDTSTDELSVDAFNDGYDGLIIKNVIDPGPKAQGYQMTIPHTDLIALQPETVKNEEPLKESKSRGLLYHITNYVGLYKIFEEDELKNNRMSLTRDKNMWYFHGCPPQTFFQLVVDGDKLSENFKIRPFADQYTELGFSENKTKYWSNEHEEQIIDTKKTYFKGFWSKYVTQVNFNEKIFLKCFKMLGGDRPGETEEIFREKVPAGFFLNVSGTLINGRIFLKDYIELIQQLDKSIKMLDGKNPVPFLKSLLEKKFNLF
jgi:hypothetical protein